MWEQLVRECEAMVQHALGTGRVVPADVMARLDQAVSAPDVPEAVAAPDRRGNDAAGSALAMETSRFVSLAMAHAGLALAIAPATPEAVLLMADERERHPVRREFRSPAARAADARPRHVFPARTSRGQRFRARQ
jgi:hypothetical protein